MPGADSSQFTAFKKYAAAAVKPTSERNSQVVPHVTSAGSLTKFLPSLTLKNVSPRQYVPVRVGVPNKKPLLANFYAQGKFYYTAGIYTPGGDYTSIINYLANLYGVSPRDVKLDVTGGSIVITYQITASTSAEPDLELIHSVVGQIALDNPGATGLTFVGDDISGYYTLTTVDGETAPVQIFMPPTVSTFAGNDGRTTIDGDNLTASFKSLAGLFFNKNDNTIYAVDQHVIRKVTLDGDVTTYAGMPNIPAGYFNGSVSATFGPLTTTQGSNPGYWGIDDAQFTNATVLQVSAALFLEYTKSISTANSSYEQNKSRFIAEGGRFPITMVKTNYGTNGETCVNTFTGDLATDVAARDNPSANCETGSWKQNSTLTITYAIANRVQFNSISKVVADSSNNIFVAEYLHIRKITPAGDVTTFAGSTFGYVNGIGGDAKFSVLWGMVIDKNNNLYVGDLSNNAIRKITPAGIVTTFAGGTFGYQDGQGISAKFSGIQGLGIDKDDNIYVSDMGGSGTASAYIRKIDQSGNVTTIAGGPRSFSIVDGPPSIARFYRPAQIAVDDNYNIYVADLVQNAIRKITPGGFVTTLAGGDRVYGYQDGLATTARFAQPNGLIIDPSGTNLYVGESGATNFSSRIRKISIPLARAPYRRTITFSTGFYAPSRMAIDSAGIIYLVEANRYRIITIDTSGNHIKAFGSGWNAPFRGASGVAVDSVGNIYVADYYTDSIYKIVPSGAITTIGRGFNQPSGVAVDSAGNVYVTDSQNYLVKKIDTLGNITTIGGGFNVPHAIAVDLQGNVYVADVSSYTVKKINTSGNTATIEGGFGQPWAVCVDSSGNVYVAYPFQNAIRKITPQGAITTIGSGFNKPYGVGVDSAGNVYVSNDTDGFNGIVKKIIY